MKYHLEKHKDKREVQDRVTPYPSHPSCPFSGTSNSCLLEAFFPSDLSYAVSQQSFPSEEFQTYTETFLKIKEQTLQKVQKVSQLEMPDCTPPRRVNCLTREGPRQQGIIMGTVGGRDRS